MSSQDFNGCPHCKNQIGFAFGTCGRCGWNHLSNEFSWIKVRTSELPYEGGYLICLHEERTRAT